MRHVFFATLMSLMAATPLASQEEKPSHKVTVKIETPILAGDLLAAREAAQGQAFEQAVLQILPPDFHAVTKQQRSKAAIRHIKSFRVVEERQIGDVLHSTYDIDVQGSALAPDPLASAPIAPVHSPEASAPPTIRSSHFQVEIVPARRLNAAEFIDQLKAQTKLTVKSFKMTRTAIILQVEDVRALEALQTEVQSFVGDRGRVSVVEVAPPPPPPLEWVPPQPTIPPTTP